MLYRTRSHYWGDLCRAAVTKLFFFFSCIKQQKRGRGVERRRTFLSKMWKSCGKGEKKNYEVFRFQPFFSFRPVRGGVSCLVAFKNYALAPSSSSSGNGSRRGRRQTTTTITATLPTNSTTGFFFLLFFFALGFILRRSTNIVRITGRINSFGTFGRQRARRKRDFTRSSRAEEQAARDDSNLPTDGIAVSSVNREGESIEKRHVEKESESNFRGVRPVSSSVGPVRFARIEENARGTRERGVDAKNKRWREHE